MENYLPIIQATLAEWLQLTIDHPLYAAALVIGVWLLTTLLYSIRISGLNKKNVASEKARTAAETELNTAQQQRQQAQDDTLAITEQLGQQQQATEAGLQRANTAEQQLAQRNQQIATIIQRLASSFDIGERPLPITEDPKAEDLWQQHDKVINRLIETLRTEQQAKTELQKFYQAEQTKVTDSEARLSSLQANLDSQASLVLTLQTQNSTLQQQQQTLADTLKQHQADSARLLELEQQLTGLKDSLTITPVKTAPEPIQPIAAQTPTTNSTENLKNLFKKPEPQPIHKQETAPPFTTEVLVKWVEQEPVIAETIEQIEPSPVIQEQTDVIVEPAQETEKAAVLKGWYNKIATKKPAPAEVTPEPIEETTEKSSLVKGLYQKFTTAKSEPTEIAPEPVAEPAPIEPIVEKPSVAKGLYQKFTAAKSEPTEITPKPVVEPKPTPAPVEQTAEKSNVTKGLHRKFTTAKPEKTEIKPQPSHDESSGRIEAVADQITDTVESLKGLYGKFFSKNK